jgi:hypothetical protein
MTACNFTKKTRILLLLDLNTKISTRRCKYMSIFAYMEFSSGSRPGCPHGSDGSSIPVDNGVLYYVDCPEYHHCGHECMQDAETKSDEEV